MALLKCPSLNEIRIIKSSKTSWTSVSLCNVRIIVAVKTHPDEVGVSVLDIDQTYYLPLMFSPLTKDTEVVGTVRMGLTLQ